VLKRSPRYSGYRLTLRHDRKEEVQQLLAAFSLPRRGPHRDAVPGNAGYDAAAVNGGAILGHGSDGIVLSRAA
jgi:hypothetical protein